MTKLEIDAIRLVFALVFGAAFVCIKEWTRFLKREGKAKKLHTYRCTHVETPEFSGGYRDFARPNVQCSYKLVFRSIMHARAGTWRARCPTHNCFLVKV